MYMYVYMYVYIYICMYIYICIYIYMYMYEVCLYININSPGLWPRACQTWLASWGDGKGICLYVGHALFKTFY